MSDRRFRPCTLPRATLVRTRLSGLDYTIMDAIAFFTQLGGPCIASNAALAARAGCHERSAKRCIKRLIDGGHVKDLNGRPGRQRTARRLLVIVHRPAADVSEYMPAARAPVKWAALPEREGRSGQHPHGEKGNRSVPRTPKTRRLQVGDLVAIKSGPLQGFQGSVAALIGKHVTILLNILGGLTQVHISHPHFSDHRSHSRIMPRHRTPLAKAEATGRTIHDPQRYRGRTEPRSAPLGAPSRTLKLLELEAWELIKREGWWLTETHRGVVEVLAMLRGRLMAQSRDLKVMAQYLAYSRELGLTPASSTKINVPEDKDADPADEFLN